MRTLALRLILCFVFRLDIIESQLDKRLIEVIERKEETVHRLAEEVSNLFERRGKYLGDCKCSLHSCTNDVRDFECSMHFGSHSEICGEGCEGRSIHFNNTMFRVPPNTDISNMSPKLKESICVFKNLEESMKELFMNDAQASWLYFGGIDGSFRIYPAQARERGEKVKGNELGSCRPYDPRIRPWFIQATTRSKDIVLVIDISLSMEDPVKQGGNKMRWDVTKRAVFAMLDTFSTFDYVSIVVFSDEATRLSVDSPLLQATEENVKFLKEQMDDQYPTGTTNFDAAFSGAFDVLTEACSKGNEKCSGCQKVILFLTDGRDSSVGRGDSIKASEMLNNIERYQKKLERETSTRAKIFTFSMGETSDDSIPRQIACRNDGAWSFIGEDTDPLTAMAGYYHFLTSPHNLETPIWLEPYEDHGGLGIVSTVTRPVYSKETRRLDGVFIGVVGYDVLQRELEIPGVPWTDVIDALRQRSQFCNVSAQSPCQLQVHRNAYANEALCVDPMSSYCGTPTRSKGEIQCYRGETKYYKLFTTESSWSHAFRRCRRDGGRLVVIESDEELAFVAGVASPDGSWIGARRSEEDFSFGWLDGRSLSRKSSYWGVGEPNNDDNDEECVHVDQRGVNGNLNDEDCDQKLSFICEYTNSRSCDGVIKIPRQGYCMIPPLSECTHEEDSIGRVRPKEAAANLSSQDLMCPLGKHKDSFEVTCCPNCRKPRG